MTDAPRDRIVASAAVLIRERGLARTGLRDVVAHAQAPWGSLAHYFPGGKNQVVREAVVLMGGLVRAELDAAVLAGDPQDALRRFAGLWREVVEESDARAGCTIAAVVAEADDDDLRATAAEVFRSWREPFVAALRESGVEPRRAARLGTTIIAGLEGALILCRAERGPRPLIDTARELEVLVDDAVRGAAVRVSRPAASAAPTGRSGRTRPSPAR